MLILGLDPGSRHTGYGLIRKQGLELLFIAEGRISLSPRLELNRRLSQLVESLDRLLDEWQPEAVALESLFHGINPRSLIVLAQARGAILALLGRRHLDVVEYSPAEVKGAVAGTGRAEKRQVARMVELLLKLEPARRDHDATDALAVAICYAQRLRMDRLSNAARGQ